MNWNVICLVICITIIKILMIPLYYSTDFNVHRNWLSITYNLSLSEWYKYDDNQWTLDYPPFFAWFEYFWGVIASYIHPECLILTSSYEYNIKTLYFQRISVIISDMILFYGIIKCVNIIKKKRLVIYKENELYIYIIILCFSNPGLLLVDHIHFQYNGFLLGVFLLTIVSILEDKPYSSAVYFSILLNLKHIFLYVAPVYFVYLLRSICFDKQNNFKLKNFTKLGIIVIIIFSISLAPFIYLGQIKQLLSRLFPFKRGLTHAYWAGNFWALYNIFDFILIKLFTSNNISISYTTGLVQDLIHIMLPNIKPSYTMILAIITMLPVLFNLWNYPKPFVFYSALLYCSMCSFMLGWHVHEKAILITLIPLSVLCMINKYTAKIFYLLNIIGNYGLFPLFVQSRETPVKILILLIHIILTYIILRQKLKLKIFEHIYLGGFLGLQIFTSIIHPLYLSNKEFLPLMLTSVYCAIGNTYIWYLCYGLNRYYVDQLKTKKQV